MPGHEMFPRHWRPKATVSGTHIPLAFDARDSDSGPGPAFSSCSPLPSGEGLGVRVLDLQQDRDTQHIPGRGHRQVPKRQSVLRPRDQAPAWSRLSSKLCFVEQRRTRAEHVSSPLGRKAEWLARGSRLARRRSEASGKGVPKLELGNEFQKPQTVPPEPGYSR